MLSLSLVVALVWNLSVVNGGWGEEEPSDPLTQVWEDLPSELKTILSTAKKLAEVVPTVSEFIGIARMIGTFLGIVHKKDAQDRELITQIAALQQHLDETVAAVSWQIGFVALDGFYAHALSSVESAQELADLGMLPLNIDGPIVQNSLAAVNGVMTDSAFKRTFVKRPADGATLALVLTGAGVEPDHPNGLVYDWRLGVPYLTTLIALRLPILAAIDPTFRLSGVLRELDKYRTALLDHYRTMLEGVHCGEYTPSFSLGLGNPPLTPWNSYESWTQYFPHDPFNVSVACTDIYSGLAIISNFKAIPSHIPRYWDFLDKVVNPLMANLRRQVLQKMPFFQMHAMIDKLFLYLHPEVSDLTVGTPQIALIAAPNLCLDVQGGQAAAGTPVWLWDCNGSNAQRWVYDRQSGAIRNPVYNRCLDVQEADPAPGTPVWLWDCNETEAQQWTYDPETGVLQSALGTVLHVQAGLLQRGTLVEMGTRDTKGASPPQQWFSETHPASSIQEKWMSLGGSMGFVGSPVTDEMATADGIGRVSHFQGASIYWHPETGAHEVHGAIRDKWASLGWESAVVSVFGWQIGYPITDELSTADGIGRVSHFQGASIYWHPNIGAFFIGGAIRQRWLEHGAERSELGYPTTDETTTGYGRYSVFTGGSIYWTPAKGTYATVFSTPMFDGYRLATCWGVDWYWRSVCGEPIAMQYCQAQGYAVADAWGTDLFDGAQQPAKHKSGELCNQGSCEGFTYISCLPD